MFMIFSKLISGCVVGCWQGAGERGEAKSIHPEKFTYVGINIEWLAKKNCSKPKYQKGTFFWAREVCFYPFKGNILTPGNPYCGPTNQQLVAEEYKYSWDRAWRRRCPTNNMIEVWQILVPFSGRPIGSTIEALLTKVINWRYR